MKKNIPPLGNREEFAIKHDKHISVTFAQDLYGIPAWMIVK